MASLIFAAQVFLAFIDAYVFQGSTKTLYRLLPILLIDMPSFGLIAYSAIAYEPKFAIVQIVAVCLTRILVWYCFGRATTRRLL
jgi:hypothetical protein